MRARTSDPHNQLYQFFQDLPKRFRPRDHVWDFRKGQPIPFLVLDRFLPDHLFDLIVRELTRIPEHSWGEFTRNSSYMQETNDLSCSGILTTLTHCLNSGCFLDWLEAVTGYRKLISDPHMIGAGVSRSGTGHALKLHTDFNWNDELALDRAISTIFYVNAEWSQDWGGALEFWDFDRQKIVQTIACTPNRFLIWAYDERLVHGYPEAIACPDDKFRYAFRTWYYQSHAEPKSQPHRSLYWYDEQSKMHYDKRDHA